METGGNGVPVSEADAGRALPSSGWLTRYVDHAMKNTTAPLIYHYGIGLSLLAVTCPPNYIDQYAGDLFSNMFALIVGRSGEDAKSAALRVGKKLLFAADPQMLGEYPGSWEGLVEQLAQKPKQLISISEFGKFLSSAQAGYFEKVKAGLCDLWDCLSTDTEILAPDGWKKWSQVQRGDTVWALDTETDTLVPSRVLEVGVRLVKPGERLLRINGQQHDICTTEGHRFYMKYKDPTRGYQLSKYIVRHGRDIAARRSPYLLPFSAEPSVQPPGVDLTDDELRFIAWFMTDGTMNRGKTVVISQSVNKYVDHIRSLLGRLGMDWREYTRPAGDVGYGNASELITFCIPEGIGQGARHRDGWAKFAPYLDKDLAPALMKMDKRQFELFWEELLLGDGSLQVRVLWTVRPLLVDRLQQMAVERGLYTHYGFSELPSGKTAFRLGIGERRLIQSRPGDPRSAKHELVVPEPGTMVWCATTEHGTLVTRRNGKVVILGNCEDQTRTLAKNKVIVARNPRLSIMAACSIPLLEKHTLPEDWSGGFMGRWLILYGRMERFDADPVGNNDDFDWLCDFLKARSKIAVAGPCLGLDPTARLRWGQWYEDLNNRSLPKMVAAMRARIAAICRRVCLLYSWDFGPAPGGEPWHIELDVLEPALELAELHLQSLVDLSEAVADSPDARLRRRILQVLQELHGEATEGRLLGELKMKPRTVAEMVSCLEKEGRVARTHTAIGDVYKLVDDTGGL